MAETSATSSKSEAKAGSTDYTRFIIVSGPRTGSHMLAQALNSSRDIVCFREVFNYLFDFVQFEVDGYDNSSARDLALREEHPLRFLDERIFGRHPEEIRAVGFKYHYEQGWAYRGLRERLVEDTEIRMVHLKRRNLLRMLLSRKIAKHGGLACGTEDGSHAETGVDKDLGQTAERGQDAASGGPQTALERSEALAEEPDDIARGAPLVHHADEADRRSLR
ncbi:MAG: hypothetical protein IIC26_05510 [Chloroflexi bacterium]|nr:hypothetical protein [Chloroflexota bacterium]